MSTMDGLGDKAGKETDLNSNDPSKTSKQSQKQKQRQKQRQKQKQKKKQKQNDATLDTEPLNRETAAREHNDKVSASKKEPAKSKKKHAKKTQTKQPADVTDEQSKDTSIVQSGTVSEAKILKNRLKKQKRREKWKLLKAQKKAGQSGGLQNINKEPVKKNTPPRLPVHKLTIRKLPPKLSEDDFIDKVYSTHPIFKEYITEYYYVAGYFAQTQFEPSVPSRCYINCTSEKTMMEVGRAIKQMAFFNNSKEKKQDSVEEGGEKTGENEDGAETIEEVYDEDTETYYPVIEKSYYQHMPSFENSDPGKKVVKVDKWDYFNGKLDEIAIYQRFCELIENDSTVQLPKNIFDYEKNHERKKKSSGSKTDGKPKTLSEKEQAYLEKKRAKKRRKRERQKKKKQEKKAKEKVDSGLEAGSGSPESKKPESADSKKSTSKQKQKQKQKETLQEK